MYITFSYDAIDGSGAWDEVQYKLNNLKDNQKKSAKVAISQTRKKNDARAVLFFTDQERPPNPEQVLSGTWQYKDFTTNSDYDKMYQKCQNFLNDELNAYQSYYARISMTNAGSHSSHLVVWYREMLS